MGLKLPHCALPQVTVQVTPAFAPSLLTTAAKLASVPAAREVGGCGFRATEIGADGVVMEMVAEVDFVA